MKARIISVAAISAATLAVAAGSASAAETQPVLAAQTPIQVFAEPKRFDLMEMDSRNHRLLAAHAQAGALTMVDTHTNKLRWDDPLGDHSSDVAIDPEDDKYFVSLDKGVAVVDSNTTKKRLYIDTNGPTDAILYDSGTGKVYAGHDDGTQLWVITAKTDKLVGHIELPGVPELMAIDSKSHRLFLNIKDKDEVAVIDTESDKIVSTWSTPATHSPHGLALDVHGGRIFVAGQSAKVSVFSLDGKSMGVIDIGPGRVDQIAFDDGNNRLYVPSSGRLVAIDVAGEGRVLGSVDIPQGTHSVAVDPDTHLVWIAYANEDHSYVQAYAPIATSAP